MTASSRAVSWVMGSPMLSPRTSAARTLAAPSRGAPSPMYLRFSIEFSFSRSRRSKKIFQIFRTKISEKSKIPDDVPLHPCLPAGLVLHPVEKLAGHKATEAVAYTDGGHARRRHGALDRRAHSRKEAVAAVQHVRAETPVIRDGHHCCQHGGIGGGDCCWAKEEMQNELTMVAIVTPARKPLKGSPPVLSKMHNQASKDCHGTL